LRYAKPIRRRDTARAVLIGPSGRLLLIRFEDPRPVTPREFWATAGGEIEAGETLSQAVLREVFEETGLGNVELGPLVWTQEHVLELSGEPVLFSERYVVVRAPHETLTAANMTELERSVIREARWWTIGEIAASQEVIYPAGLAALLEPILRGDYPSEPLKLDLP
jgi:ADP-ribose pyrophosphatase YjhB (NUDIX family)